MTLTRAQKYAISMSPKNMWRKKYVRPDLKGTCEKCKRKIPLIRKLGRLGTMDAHLSVCRPADNRPLAERLENGD